MNSVFGEATLQALILIYELDQQFVNIFWLTIRVSIPALVIACVLGFPLGAWLAVTKSKARSSILVVLNALMGMPPVVLGLGVYMILSRSGPLGWMGILYTPMAMIIAQIILITPIIGALSFQILEELHREYEDLFVSLCVPKSSAVLAYLYDARLSLLTVVLAGFGRAISEVGAVIIVGGNIDNLTRVMTTAIALETSKGNFALALALGMVLLILALAVNIVAQVLKGSFSVISNGR